MKSPQLWKAEQLSRMPFLEFPLAQWQMLKQYMAKEAAGSSVQVHVNLEGFLYTLLLRANADLELRHHLSPFLPPFAPQCLAATWLCVWLFSSPPDSRVPAHSTPKLAASL